MTDTHFITLQTDYLMNIISLILELISLST